MLVLFVSPVYAWGSWVYGPQYYEGIRCHTNNNNIVQILDQASMMAYIDGAYSYRQGFAEVNYSGTILDQSIRVQSRLFNSGGSLVASSAWRGKIAAAIGLLFRQALFTVATPH